MAGCENALYRQNARGIAAINPLNLMKDFAVIHPKLTLHGGSRATILLFSVDILPHSGPEKLVFPP